MLGVVIPNEICTPFFTQYSTKFYSEI